MKDNKTYKAIKAILLNYRLINPELVSDGYGEFPDAYRMKDTDAEDIATEIININKTERKCEYCLGTGIIENGEECEECDGLGKVWLEESEQDGPFHTAEEMREILKDKTYKSKRPNIQDYTFNKKTDRWYKENGDDYDNDLQNYIDFLEDENYKLRYMVENGLGEADLENDCL
jgi:RecJ-like exonuclease